MSVPSSEQPLLDVRGLTPPVRHPLIFGPTPLVRALRTSQQLGIDLWVKRDDLTGIGVSGNKVRKLEFFAADARAQGADLFVTCGGVNSNHARATAVVGAQLGLKSHLVLRGQDRRPPTGNLLLDKYLGADVTFISRQAWDDRNAIMADLGERLSREGHRPYIIPEGGSNARGTLGYALAVPELLAQCRAANLDPRRLIHANGSGGTTAGLAIGLAACERTDIEVLGIAVCNDRTFFDERIGSILDEMVDRGWVSAATRAQARWTILDGYKGRGYGRTTTEELAAQMSFARTEGLFVDPVYSGKAFVAVKGEAEAGRLSDGPTVFIHTGGIFELFAFGDQIDAVIDSA